MQPIMLRAGVAIGLAAVATLPPPQADVQALAIEAASVTEAGRIRIGRVRGRAVEIRVELSDEPTCAVRGTPLQVGILVDSDRDRSTGTRGRRAFGDLGVEARIMAMCDLFRGVLFSPSGTVTLETTRTGGTAVVISTTVDALPSPDFDWVAYVTDGQRMRRAPSARDARMRFAITEIILP